MRKMNCPQCRINRFFVKNEKGETLLVNVTVNREVTPVHPEESLDGFNLDLLYCLGCSWVGSPRTLNNNNL